jgi:hypothetical protein
MREADNRDSQSDAGDAWAVEIKRRLDEMDSGQAIMIPWPEARRSIRVQDENSSDSDP